MINNVFSIYDILICDLGEIYPTPYLVRYASVLFALLFMYVLITRMGSFVKQITSFQDNLQTQLADQEQELQQTYAQLETYAREQERHQERSRIYKELHDGVGAHIISAINQIDDGQPNKELLLATLQDSLDQIKISIDAVNLPYDDVAGLLGNFRFRLTDRFKSAGIELDWQVEKLPPLPNFTYKDIRNLQFVLFEAISNVIQHSRANKLTIIAHESHQGVCISIIDNGIGFDPQQHHLRGLKTMYERVKSMNARLEITSQVGQTTVNLCLVSKNQI